MSDSTKLLFVLCVLACESRERAPQRITYTYPDWVARPESVGPVRVGMTAKEARLALGLAPESAGAKRELCYYLEVNGAPVHFMIENDTVVRFDVRDPTVRTAAGARVGDSEARVLELYGNRAKVGPHKYTDGHYLDVAPGSDSLYRIIFETEKNRVTIYRAGRLPAVAHVERCG